MSPKGRGSQERHRPRDQRGKTAAGTKSGRLEKDSLHILSSQAQRQRRMADVMAMPPSWPERRSRLMKETRSGLRRAVNTMARGLGITQRKR